MSRAQERIERAAKRNSNVHKNTTNKNAKPLKQRVARRLHNAISKLYPELHLQEYETFNTQTTRKYKVEAEQIIEMVRKELRSKKAAEAWLNDQYDSEG